MDQKGTSVSQKERTALGYDERMNWNTEPLVLDPKICEAVHMKCDLALAIVHSIQNEFKDLVRFGTPMPLPWDTKTVVWNPCCTNPSTRNIGKKVNQDNLTSKQQGLVTHFSGFPDLMLSIWKTKPARGKLVYVTDPHVTVTPNASVPDQFDLQMHCPHVWVEDKDVSDRDVAKLLYNQIQKQ